MSVYEHFSEYDLEILRQRAERAATLTDDANDQQQSALLVQLNDELYALPIDMLVSVYHGIIIVPVPCVPLFVSGIANIRGRITPVLDLAQLLGIPRSTETNKHDLVLASNEQLTLALKVRHVSEVIQFSTNALTPIPESNAMDKHKYVQGLLPTGAILLNLNTLLGDDAIIVNQLTSGGHDEF